MGKLKIDVLGTSFTIEAEEDTAYLEKLLNYYKQMTQKTEVNTKLNDLLKVSIISGIMLCDELYKEKLKNQKNKNSVVLDNFELSEAERLTMKMITDINKVLD